MLCMASSACCHPCTSPMAALLSRIFMSKSASPLSSSVLGILFLTWCRLVACICCRELGRRYCCPGLCCSGLQEITDEDRADVQAFPFDEESEAASLGIEAHHGEEGYSTLERRSVLDLNMWLWLRAIANLYISWCTSLVPLRGLAEFEIGDAYDEGCATMAGG